MEELENTRNVLQIRRDVLLNRFQTLNTLVAEVCADLANANADLARIDERIKIQEVSKPDSEEEE